ncbi:hypothetical protein MBT42_12680 [Streptomyces sp. MBT42]|uniref:hypothetical protein n=1 Tax=Streptomyces sp. MBT42 TaxID=1488373 RepID=UPI001E4EE1FD|nr:hypothetical protein [Streptomyces sp. MBT42]MCD2464410.1 hypothetical protein [Streptomyces sp. MBT42]
MDLEGIGALTAAGVAVFGVLASVLVGRWQMRAALRAAEATGQAGLAQAEAAYRAALDAVRAQANAGHRQWHRGVQREAYAAFLLAAHRVRDVGERFVVESEQELSAEDVRAGRAGLDDALAALKAAQTIVELEGPDEVAAPAAAMTDAAQLMSHFLGAQAVYERAWAKLGRLAGAGGGRSASALVDALERLRAGLRAAEEDGEESGAESGAGERACREAWGALPAGALDDDEFRALLEGWSSRPPASSRAYLDSVTRFGEAEARFVRAAKVELHSGSRS